MERLGVADPWTDGLNDAIARSAMPAGDGPGRAAGAAGAEAPRPAGDDDDEAAADAEADAAADAATASTARPADAADVLAALQDPSHPLSLQSALRAAPATSAPELSGPGAALPVPVLERGAAAFGPSHRGLEVLRLATRMPASLGAEGESMEGRVMAAVRQLRRQRAEAEQEAEARAQARRIAGRAREAEGRRREGAAAADEGAEGARDPPHRSSREGRAAAAPSGHAAAVALPESALQRVAGPDGQTMLVLTAEQLRAMTGAVGGVATPPRGARGRRGASLLDVSADSGLSEGAMDVGMRVKRSFGAAATPSAPRGRAPRSRSPLASPGRRALLSRGAGGSESPRGEAAPFSAEALGRGHDAAARRPETAPLVTGPARLRMR